MKIELTPSQGLDVAGALRLAVAILDNTNGRKDVLAKVATDIERQAIDEYTVRIVTQKAQFKNSNAQQ